MASFPTIRSGFAVCSHPATLATERATTLVKFVDDHEQRWRKAVGLIRFTITFTDINGYDMSKVRAFFQSQKGRFTSTTFDITIAGATYSSCVFDTDDIAPTENKPNLYSFTLPIRQLKA